MVEPTKDPSKDEDALKDQEESKTVTNIHEVDQSMSNMPINEPDEQDMLDLLETRMKKLGLNPEQKSLLRDGLKSFTFTRVAEQVAEGLRAKGKFDEASELSDMAPLFDPHDFWHNQPVPKFGEKINDASLLDKPIETKTVDQISSTPLDLPPGYNWADVNLNSEAECQELYQLLTNNYVEDDDAYFRFDYSVPFLRWALQPPTGVKSWLVGVRGGKKNRLFGFIAGIPVHLGLNGIDKQVCEINFLCVHKNLRTKRLAPVLIKEITRRVNLTDTWQAVYTAGITIPTPVANSTYWHRSLNPKKLVETHFSPLPAGTPMSRYLKLQKLPAKPQIPGMRPMEPRDVPTVYKLLNTYLQSRKVHMQFTEAETAHFFLPRENVINSYVVEDSQTITDFFSFYTLPSTILRHDTHKILQAAYSYYNVTTTDRLKEGVEDMLIIARDLGYDVFNCLDVMENAQFFETLKFNIGDGHLHYYLYNWRVGGDEVTPKDIGIVLV